MPPDVTPTGSLRRRRSRVPSEEDESTLMEFLQASGQTANRERKSWGSLGNLIFTSTKFHTENVKHLQKLALKISIFYL